MCVRISREHTKTIAQPMRFKRMYEFHHTGFTISSLARDSIVHTVYRCKLIQSGWNIHYSIKKYQLHIRHIERTLSIVFVLSGPENLKSHNYIISEIKMWVMTHNSLKHTVQTIAMSQHYGNLSYELSICKLFSIADILESSNSISPSFSFSFSHLIYSFHCAFLCE